MQFQVVAEHEFEAAHVLKDDPSCGRTHGHRYRVKVTAIGRFDLPKGRLVDIPVETALRAVLDELDGKDLNEMLLGTFTAPENIAAWITERLISTLPSLLSVEVWQSPRRGAIVLREVPT